MGLKVKRFGAKINNKTTPKLKWEKTGLRKEEASAALSKNRQHRAAGSTHCPGQGWQAAGAECL